jgi:hypothetical protein
MRQSKPGFSLNPIAATVVVLFFLAVAILLFSLAMGGRNPDEDHYMLGGRLFAGHVIYEDYLYTQPPFHAALLGSVYQLSNDLFGVCSHPCYFFVARLLNWLLAFGVVAVFYLLLRTMFERHVAIVCCMLLIFTSSFFMRRASFVTT